MIRNIPGLALIILILSACTGEGVNKSPVIGDTFEVFEKKYGDARIQENDYRSFTAYFDSNSLTVMFNLGMEEEGVSSAYWISGHLHNTKSISEVLDEIDRLYIPSNYSYGGPSCNQQLQNEGTEFFNERLGFYFVNETDEYNYGIRVDLIANADDGSISQSVAVQDEIGTINENTYDCELEVNERINVGDL
ncbi:hypothetical protein ABC345_20670 [Shouchella sp. 1P09AA]|uniref:hypothetical protein n=1 Tax=unclassified Shouchella TaxID=2893065 RepID=UPI0039A37B3E